jgi:hypothetical protein
MPGKPDKGLSLAMTIRDPVVIRATMDSIMSEWIQTNQSGAKSWLSKTDSAPPDWVKKWQAKTAAK